MADIAPASGDGRDGINGIDMGNFLKVGRQACDLISKVLHAEEEVVPSFWPCAAKYAAYVMRHNSTGRLW
eukprot:12936865-Prorocentrum_lima.AAC.1